MSTESTANITAIIWDVDGVWTDEYREPGINFNALCDDAYSQAAKQLHAAVDIEAAKRHTRRSYDVHGNSITGLAEAVAREHGVDLADFRSKLFDLAHRILFERVEAEFPTLSMRCPTTIAAMERLNGSVRHGVATHSCIEHWTDPTFHKIGIQKFFNNGAMVDHRAVDFENKVESARAIKTALDRLGVLARHAAFPEDNVLHLKKAKEVCPELTTVLISHGRPVEKPVWVDRVEAEPVTLLESIESARRDLEHS